MTVRLVRAGTLAEAVTALEGADRLAVDTEFHTEGRWLPALYLVQIHVPGGDTWVVDPLVREHLEGVGPALLSTPWIVHAGYQDLRLVRHALGGLPPEVHDTQIAAGLAGERYPASLASLLARWMDVPMDKADRMSDWSKRPLDPDQVAYAAADVAHLVALWDALAADATGRGHGDALAAACEEARLSASDEPAPGADWRRAIGRSSLTPRDIAALRALVVWRDTEALRADKPPPFILGHANLRNLARSRPADDDALGRNRRLSRKTLHKHGKAILAAIAEAEALPEDEIPRVVRPATDAARRLSFLEALAAGIAAHRGAAPRLVLPEERLSDLALTPAPDRHVVAEVLGPWRDALVGDTVHAALRGDLALRLSPQDVVVETP